MKKLFILCAAIMLMFALGSCKGGIVDPVDGLGAEPLSENSGWLLAGTAPQKYLLYADESEFHGGTKSACIKSTAAEYADGDFATVLQVFNAKDFTGKKVEFSGYVKTHEVERMCGLWMRIDDSVAAVLRFDNMGDRPVTGTTEWSRYSVVLDVPDCAAYINIGMLLNGGGQAWLGDVSFREVPDDTPVTYTVPDIDYLLNLPDFPVDLEFEGM